MTIIEKARINAPKEKLALVNERTILSGNLLPFYNGLKNVNTDTVQVRDLTNEVRVRTERIAAITKLLPEYDRYILRLIDTSPWTKIATPNDYQFGYFAPNLIFKKIIQVVNKTISETINAGTEDEEIAESVNQLKVVFGFPENIIKWTEYATMRFMDGRNIEFGIGFDAKDGVVFFINDAIEEPTDIEVTVYGRVQNGFGSEVSVYNLELIEPVMLGKNYFGKFYVNVGSQIPVSIGSKLPKYYVPNVSYFPLKKNSTIQNSVLDMQKFGKMQMHIVQEHPGVKLLSPNPIMLSVKHHNRIVTEIKLKHFVNGVESDLIANTPIPVVHITEILLDEK
jgi:hypothetical protein